MQDRDGTVPMEELVPADPNLYFRVPIPEVEPRRWWSRGRMHEERRPSFRTPRYGSILREPLLIGEAVEHGITRIIRAYGGVCFEPPLYEQLVSVSKAGVRVHLIKVIQVLAEHLERLPPGEESHRPVVGR